MARVLVTGSSDGIGLMAGRLLLQEGHGVTHARNEERGADLRRSVPGGCPTVVIGDLASLEQTRSVAGQANRIGRHDAVIHNAGIGFHRQPARPARTATNSPSPSTCWPPTCSPLSSIGRDGWSI